MKESLFALLFSQTMTAGPELGTNMIMLEKTELGDTYHPSWYVGGNVEYYFSDNFSLRSGAYFSQRQKVYESADTSQLTVFGFSPDDLGIPGVDFSVYSKTKGVVSQFGIEVPLMASFNFKGVSFFAGPYMHFMVGSWSKETQDTRIPFLQAINIDSIDQSGILSSLFPPAESHTFTESSSKENLRVFDYGFKAGASYTANRLRVNAYYTFGIPDYRLDLGTDVVKSHQYLTVSVAYIFGRNSKSRSSFGD